MTVSSGIAFAQEATTSATDFWSDPFNDPLFPLYMVIGFVFLVALLVVAVAFYMIKVLNVFVRKVAEDRAAKLGIPYKPEQGFWLTFWNRINAFKPVEKEADILLDHNFDGIKELDNHLPPWWTWLFYITIVWSVIYLVVYHVSDTLPLQDEEYQQEVSLAEQQKQQLTSLQPQESIDEAALAFENDSEIIQRGRKVYATNCASCHNPEGQGGIGPNLTDQYWLHGGSITNIYQTIKVGVPEKGMIPWGPVLSPSQIRDVSFYIMSIQGTNPSNPKEPQGALYVPDSKLATPDSVKSTN
jgi:cytochrome c oxidase cbb3-type subunit III